MNYDNNIMETLASFLATGISPDKSIIFNQSSVSGHAELAWILNCVSRLGWLNRMTQFKDKAGSDKEKASVGLYIPKFNGCGYSPLQSYSRSCWCGIKNNI